ncbi:MAG: hypothetical protein JEZ12_12960, partial [Desulfobacterium sp.]|nr:hypothetical protein [Desulfobacterium sp.]
MKMLSVHIRGAIGFQKDMGAEEINLDLSNLTGLIGLSGPNGYGKTTLLEFFSPFRGLVSRKGTLSSHFYLRDSFIDKLFLLNGDRYRTLIKLDAETGKSEGFIWKNDVPQVKGKVSEYDAYIKALCGSSTLFYNSVFCAQDAVKFSKLTTGQLKALFVEFLRLDRFAVYADTSKQCCNTLNGSALQESRALQDAKDRLAALGNVEASRQAQKQAQATTEGDLTAEKGFLSKALADIK